MQASLTRREKERELHRKHVMEVALDLFSEFGYHEVSMQQIAAASEFSVGTLYNYFENKDTLFQMILDVACEEVLKILLPALEGPGNEQARVSQYIHTLVPILERHSRVIRLYTAIHGQKISTSTAREPDQKFRLMILTSLEQVIVSGITHQVFKPVPPDMAALSLFVTLEAVTFNLVNGMYTETPQDIVEKLEQLFLDTLLKK